jgi:PhoH-like ATPase
LNNKRKNFILDTSVLVYHEDSIHAFPNQNVIIPMEVLEEVDNLKTRHDSVGNAARYINRFLDNLRDIGSLKDGVTLENGETIFVHVSNEYDELPSSMLQTNDNRIIAVALKLSKTTENVVLISRDINVRVKCDSLGISSENYHKEKAVVNRRGAYTGVSVKTLDPEDVQTFYEEGGLRYDGGDVYPNEFLVLKGGAKSALGYYQGGMIKPLKSNTRNMSVQGISPRNKEQTFALESLLNPDIHLATLTGIAGSGKTLLSTAAAVHMLTEGIYDKIVISRPIQSLSGDVGFLPGSKFEKMEPWIQPIIDNLKYIFKNGESYFQMMMEKGTLEVEALSFVRGRSLPNTIFILDEAQNITYTEAKAVITRMGENSKLVMLGDLEQIDAPHLDAATCGLGAVVEKFKDFHLSSHITLLKGERSPLAAYAAKIL